MRNLKPVFEWAKANGDANIYDRILIKIMPELLKNKMNLTSESINEAESIEVDTELYNYIVEKTEDLLSMKFTQKEM